MNEKKWTCPECGGTYALRQGLANLCCLAEYKMMQVRKGEPIDVPLAPQVMQAAMTSICYLDMLARLQPKLRDWVAEEFQKRVEKDLW